jgi:hypothetical protein
MKPLHHGVNGVSTTEAGLLIANVIDDNEAGRNVHQKD